MTEPSHLQNSQLFTLRIWAEPQDGDRSEWRGLLKHIPTGESLYFREWAMLIQQIQKILENEVRP